MIAPLREPSVSPTDDRLRAARNVVATLLRESKPTEPPACPVPAWQAWLLTGWIVATALAYGAILLGW